jgi:hypothetical protein
MSENGKVEAPSQQLPYFKATQLPDGNVTLDFLGHDTQLLGLIDFARILVSKRMSGNIHEALLNSGQTQVLKNPQDAPPPSLL